MEKLILYRPINSNLKTQGFGIKETASSLLEYYQAMNLQAHNGLDLKAYDGEPCYFNANYQGKVIGITDDPKLGIGLTIAVEAPEGLYQLRFWHLKGYCVKVGQLLDSGQLCGWCNNSGWSFGTHLHFDLKEATYLANGVYTVLNKDNGMFGAISPELYWDNRFVLDIIENLNQQISVIGKLINLYKQLFGLKR